MQYSKYLLCLANLISASTLYATPAEYTALTAFKPHSEIVYYTPSPFGGDFGYLGFEIYSQQSVAIRFQMPEDKHKPEYQLDMLGVWMFKDLYSDNVKVKISLNYNDNSSISSGEPSEKALASWEVILDPAFEHHPQLVQLTPEQAKHKKIKLKPGEYYWVVVETLSSDEKGKQWAVSKDSQLGSYMALKIDNVWQPHAADQGMIPSVVVTASSSQ